jgi:hypothetical protein
VPRITDRGKQTAARDEVLRARILDHVEWVLVAHVDHRGADFCPAGLRANCGKQRERRCKLTGEVMDPEERSVHPQLFSGDGKVNGLEQGIRGRPRL